MRNGEIKVMKIFVDLEFCEIDKENRHLKKYSSYEIIEIGAVKLDDENEIVSSFDAFVKPEYSHINSFVSNLTGINDSTVKDAKNYNEVALEFLNWIDDYDNIEIYSWSNSDLQQFKHENALKSFEDSRFELLFAKWKDFQKIFSKLLSISQNLKLDTALKGAGIPFQGHEHAAIADAKNTALLFALTKTKRNSIKKQV